MSTTMSDAAADMTVLQCNLEQTITTYINDFESRTGLSVHSVKVFRGEPKNGKRMVTSVEISALLR